jgi:dynein heavy chain
MVCCSCVLLLQALEDNQVQVQGMIANRYMNTFKDEILGWQRKLNDVADVNQIMSEIQKSWAYLESLFIHSDEVKKELPEAAERFAKIDSEIKQAREAAQRAHFLSSCLRSWGLRPEDARAPS